MVSNPSVIVRGTTVQFATTFLDGSGNITQPSGAAINLSYLENGTAQEEEIEMTAPTDGGTSWTAQWDTRGVSPCHVSWSIHSESSGIPYVVQDGSFDLVANNANLVTF